MFLVQTSDLPRIVLSIKYLEELRAVPESKLSHREGVCDRFLGSYTGMDAVRHSHLHNDVCQVQLVQNLGAMLPNMLEEAMLAFSDNLASDARSFVPFQSYSTIFNIVARMNSRVLAGAPTCRDKEWLEVSEGYPQDVIHVASDLRQYNMLLRPLVYPFLASAARLRRYYSIAQKQLTPLIAERVLSAEKDKPRDVLQWMINLARGEDAKPANLIGKMLFLTMATFHASTATAVHAVYDLCTMPEYIEPLRKEIREALRAEGGTWNLAVLHRLKRLDSFLKESQRMNAPGLLGFNRKVMSPTTLSDGVTLPEGIIITMPIHQITRDPEYWSDPDTFRGFRFFERRQLSTEDDIKNQFASLDPYGLGFGYGKFACPGRIYASAQLKLLLGLLLHKYDIKFPNEQAIRPANLFIDDMILPERKKPVLSRFRGQVEA